MASTRDIVRRIKSVKNTKKVTKAMELVSAAKMRKAVESVLRTRSYANLSWLTVLNLANMARKNETVHDLLRERKDIKRVCVVLITSNRGLCGGFNANMINKVVRSIKLHEGVETDFMLLGKKGASVHYKFGYHVAAEFEKPDVAFEVGEIIPLARMVVGDYLNGTYDRVFVAYTDFVSSLKQVPRVRQLLPVALTSLSLEEEGEEGRSFLRADGAGTEYIFEPSPREVLDEMIPRLLEVQLFQALLESNASEHSARMLAMRNASDAADEMVDGLTLSYNKARQAGITSEIAEIAGGAAALQE